MSQTTIKAIYPGEKHLDIQELSNSWGSAPVVWDAVANRYLGKNYSDLMAYGDMKELWPLWKDPTIPIEIRAVLMMTYDRLYVAKKDYARAARDIRYFLRAFPPKSGWANHWPWIAEFFESDPDYPGIGFHHTSVSEDPYDGPYDEDKEEHGPPDWSTVYSLYDELNTAQEKTT